VINRYGLNSEGLAVFTERLKYWRESGPVRGLVGVNIGKNKDTVNDADDFVVCAQALAAYADYISINVSSPNTPGLRDLQSKGRLTTILHGVISARNEKRRETKIFLKIAPDLVGEQMEEITEAALATGIDAIIISNTTAARILHSTTNDFYHKAGAGGLSGRPLFLPSTRILHEMYGMTKGQIPLIGCGGISSGEDAYAKIRAGASLIQLYTALVFEGPGLVRKIKRDLAALLKRDGFRAVGDAVGADHKR
jgi:dihydroorotate dehydrogenase